MLELELELGLELEEAVGVFFEAPALRVASNLAPAGISAVGAGCVEVAGEAGITEGLAVAVAGDASSFLRASTWELAFPSPLAPPPPIPFPFPMLPLVPGAAIPPAEAIVLLMMSLISSCSASL